MKNQGLLLLLGLEYIISHSWLDCTDRRPDGSCYGYIRNYQGHSDIYSSYKILNHNPTSPLCEPRYQSLPAIYSQQYPMAQAKPGSVLNFDYLENGHINVDRYPPDMKPNPKFYSVYSTRKPFTGDMSDGSQLIYRRDIEGLEPLFNAPFDDGECADITYNGRIGPKPCKGGIKIPESWKEGVYQFVWVWHFDRDLNAKGEEYTSCFDVNILSPQVYDEVHGRSLLSSVDTSPDEPNAIDNHFDLLEDGRGLCNQQYFDPSKYSCLKGNLCPRGDMLCGSNQCFDPAVLKCCNKRTLKPIKDECNPFLVNVNRLKNIDLL